MHSVIVMTFVSLRRVNELKPRMVLDHLVKERYPRFIDAVRDLDDCLCMIHLFAALPSAGRITAERTSACAKLSREWQYFVSKSHSLRKVFVSVKGIYYQAEVMGETINWLVPHAFTQHIPPAVDFRVMVTFMEFYEIFFKFVLYKLYAKEGWQYPPQVDEKLDLAGCCLLAMKSDNSSTAATVSTKESKKVAAAAADSSTKKAQVTAVDAKEFAGQVKSLPEFLKQQQDEEDDDEEEDDLDISAPLTAAFSDLQRHATEDDDNDREVFQRSEAAQQDQRANLFNKLTFFVNREVPLSIMQLCITAFGGRVSWDGPGAPYASDDRSITHHVVDRPVQNQATAAGSVAREYIQPQWVFDSINAGVLLPVRLYAPGAKLPPHLSPFVDDEKEGYLPRFREEVQKLQIEAGVLDGSAVTTTTEKAASSKASKSTNSKTTANVTGKKRAIDVDEDESSEEEEEEDSESEEDEEDSEEDDEEEEDSEAEELLEVPTSSKQSSKQNNSSNNSSSSSKKAAAKPEAQPATTTSNKKGPKAIVQQAKVAKQSEVSHSYHTSLPFPLFGFCCFSWPVRVLWVRLVYDWLHRLHSHVFRSKGSSTFAPDRLTQLVTTAVGVQ